MRCILLLKKDHIGLSSEGVLSSPVTVTIEKVWNNNGQVESLIAYATNSNQSAYVNIHAVCEKGEAMRE